MRAWCGRRWQVWACLSSVCLLLTAYTAYRDTTPTPQPACLQSPRFLPFPSDAHLDAAPPTPAPHTELKVPIVPWWEGGAGCGGCRGPSCLSTLDPATLDTVGGTCGRRAWAEGGGQRVVALYLYGSEPYYWGCLEKIVQQVEDKYPGWVVWLYTDPRPHAPLLCPLLSRHPHRLYLCDILNLPPPLGSLLHVHPALLPVAPFGDPQVEALLSRHVTHQVTDREVAAVAEWLNSTLPFHTMRDHLDHDAPVLAGLWGARWDQNHDTAAAGRTEEALVALRDRIFREGTGQTDEGVRNIVWEGLLWGAMRERGVLAHDSYSCSKFGGSKPWPTRREGRHHVGAPRSRGNQSLIPPCPPACRPVHHQDWLYC